MVSQTGFREDTCTCKKQVLQSVLEETVTIAQYALNMPVLRDKYRSGQWNLLVNSANQVS